MGIQRLAIRPVNLHDTSKPLYPSYPLIRSQSGVLIYPSKVSFLAWDSFDRNFRRYCPDCQAGLRVKIYDFESSITPISQVLLRFSNRIYTHDLTPPIRPRL